MAIRLEVKVVVVYLIFVAVLALVQVTYDNLRADKDGLRYYYPPDNQFADSVSIYNACSSPLAVGTSSIRNKVLSSIPLAYKTLPPSPHVDSCYKDNPKRRVGENKDGNHSSSYSSSYICQKLFKDTLLTVDEDKWLTETNNKNIIAIPELLRKSRDCKWMKDQFRDHHVSEEEKAFPIAYSITLDKYPHQIFRFLKVIYRPHNVYCIHYDRKSSSDTKQIIHNVASCFGNMIIPRVVADVYWGWHTIEDAFINCFSDLVLARDNYPWKYVFTLCGKELPLRTNAEIVSILKPLNGTSSVQLVGKDGLDTFKYKWKWSLNKFTLWVTKKDERLDPIPFNLKVYKSWAYVALSFQFVEYYLCSDVGIALREYMKDVRIPEENIYAMLFMRPNVPGGYSPQYKHHIFPVTSYIWLDGDHHGLKRKLNLIYDPVQICDGGNVHYICMVSAKDLHRLPYRPGIIGQQSDSYLHPDRSNFYSGADRGPLFHNRYSIDADHVVMDCMEEELERRNVLEYEKDCVKSS